MENTTTFATEIERNGNEYLVSTIQLENGRWETIVFFTRNFWPQEVWARRVNTYAEAVEDHNWAVKTWQPEGT